MLGNTPQQPVDFNVEQAKSFAFCIKVQYENGLPYDTTDASFRLTIDRPRRLGGTLMLLDEAHETGIDGVLQFRIQASTFNTPPGEYPYDITMITPEDYSVPLVKGVFNIGANTYPLYNNIYDFSNPEEWITFTIKNNATIKTLVPDNTGLHSWVGPPGVLSPAMRELIEDTVAGTLVAGPNVSLNYNDAANELQISAADTFSAGIQSPTTRELIQDIVGAMLIPGPNVTIDYTDGSNQLMISSTGGGGIGSFTGYNPIYALAYEA